MREQHHMVPSQLGFDSSNISQLRVGTGCLSCQLQLVERYWILQKVAPPALDWASEWQKSGQCCSLPTKNWDTHMAAAVGRSSLSGWSPWDCLGASWLWFTVCLTGRVHVSQMGEVLQWCYSVLILCSVLATKHLSSKKPFWNLLEAGSDCLIFLKYESGRTSSFLSRIIQGLTVQTVLRQAFL